MADFTFALAVRSARKARIALIGPSGSGKTFVALELAAGLGQKVAVIDTENASASLYADRFEFDSLALRSFAPAVYVEAIKAAAGYDVVIVDSLSHAWVGKDGALAMVDKAAVKYQGNSYAAWRDVTPQHNALVDALVFCPAHLIVTMRVKTEYQVQKDEKSGKMKPVKIGLAPVQRDGLEYEFDFVADLDLEHNLVVSKTRYPAFDGAVISMPTREMGSQIGSWLSEGKPQVAESPQKAPETGAEPLETIQSTVPDQYVTPTAFWAKVRALGMTREAGRILLEQEGGSFEGAYARLE